MRFVYHNEATGGHYAVCVQGVRPAVLQDRFVFGRTGASKLQAEGHYTKDVRVENKAATDTSSRR